VQVGPDSRSDLVFNELRPHDFLFVIFVPDAPVRSDHCNRKRFSGFRNGHPKGNINRGWSTEVNHRLRFSIKNYDREVPTNRRNGRPKCPVLEVGVLELITGLY